MGKIHAQVIKTPLKISLEKIEEKLQVFSQSLERSYNLLVKMIEECEKSPSRALTLLVQVFTKNPGMIQNTIKKIGNRLQQKVQSGQIRPQEIAREAEELMKEFSSNPEFVDVMESLKSMFGFEDMDSARQAGREGSARLALVQQRLRKKLDAKKAAKK
jgi:ribosomal protein S17E